MAAEFETDAQQAIEVSEREERIREFLQGGGSILIAEKAVAAYVDYLREEGEVSRILTERRIAGYEPVETEVNLEQLRIASERSRQEAAAHFRRAADFGAIAMAAKMVEDARLTSPLA
ncbi:MAG TPA: hypothetical protein VFI84_04195 [Candidatus Saccharimonadales bacterium]|nr:hypothetical protein [Candidatus Saccharimonadales bacterium]